MSNAATINPVMRQVAMLCNMIHRTSKAPPQLHPTPLIHHTLTLRDPRLAQCLHYTFDLVCAP